MTGLMAEPTWSWQVSTDPEAVHALLRASDEHHARAYGLPVPDRRPARTRQLVAAGAVQVLHDGTRPVAMFTLTGEPPFDEDLSIFPPARRAVYVQRLAIDPRSLASVPLLGARCLRRAIELARAHGADALRAEANPDLTAVAELLATFGFARCGPVRSAGRLRRVYLQKPLQAAPGPAVVPDGQPPA